MTQLHMILMAALLIMTLLPSIVLADDFSGSGITADWELTAGESKLLLPVYAFDQQGRGIDRGTKLLRAAPDGDWTMEAALTAEMPNAVHAGLAVYADGDNWLLFGMNGAAQVTVTGRIGGRDWRGMSMPGQYGYIRISRTGNAYRFHYSVNGEAWQTLGRSFIDEDNALAAAQIGLMGRNTDSVDIFHSEWMSVPCVGVEVAAFTVNGAEIPLALMGHGWAYTKAQGVMPLAAAAGTRTLYLRPQQQGDWVLGGCINYADGDEQARSGLVLWVDEDNYLSLTVRGRVDVNYPLYEVSGVIGGEKTGLLAEHRGEGLTDRMLRIIRRTEKNQPDRYYFYVSNGITEDRMEYLCCYEDETGLLRNAKYGLMVDAEASSNHCAAQFEYCSDHRALAWQDAFISKVLDGQWRVIDAERLSVGNKKLTFSSGEAGPAFLLRAPMDADWAMETTLSFMTVNSTAGLAIRAGENWLGFGLRGRQLVMTVSTGGETTETVVEASSKSLRMVKEGRTYIMQYLTEGFAWQEGCRFTDETGALDDARVGLFVQGKTCSFAQHQLGYRPTGRMAAVENVQVLFPLTGERGINQTQSRWGFGSGDLGAVFEHEGKVYMVYGDTFSGDALAGGWINNAVAVGSVTDPAEGVRFDHIFMGETGTGCVKAAYDHTCAIIPSCGFGEGNDLYMWIHEIYSWQGGGHRDIHTSGWAVSKDGGKTWDYAPLFDGDSPFQFVACLRQGDVLYLYGNLGGGYGATYLMTVPAASALDKTAYRYFAGRDEQDDPCWSDEENDAQPVFDWHLREIGVTWNEYLGCYLMTGLEQQTQQIVILDALQPAGPWSLPTTLINRQYMPQTWGGGPYSHIYGAYSTENLVKNSGQTQFFTLSDYTPYQVFWLQVDFEKSK